MKRLTFEKLTSWLLTITMLFAGFGLLAVSSILSDMAEEEGARLASGVHSYEQMAEFFAVELSYNEDGQLVDRGSTEQAQAILNFLKEDLGYPVIESELDPDDPLVNTGTEQAYQFATISYHVGHGTQRVTLTETTHFDANRNGEIDEGTPVYTPKTLPAEWNPYEEAVFEAGTYEVPVDMRTYSQFNRSNPLDGPARSDAWSGAHPLLAMLANGMNTAGVLEMGDKLVGFVELGADLTLYAGWAFIAGTTVIMGIGLYLSRREDT